MSWSQSSQLDSRNFDIENLERKNIYPVTDDFFARMQEHVLNEVKQAPIIEMKPRTKPFPMWWAAAAVLALVSSTSPPGMRDTVLCAGAPVIADAMVDRANCICNL